MNCIKKIFEAVGSYGIIGPHEGYIPELLLCGAKPMGMVAYLDKPEPENLHLKEQAIADIELLQRAVRSGTLHERKLIWEQFLWRDGKKATAHFFCQNGKEREMEKIVEWHKKYWREGKMDNLPYDLGKFYGYNDEDIELFKQGGYSNGIFDRILMHSQSIRRYCRYQAMKMSIE